MDQLPDLNSPDRNYEEEIALNTCAVAYVGNYFPNSRGLPLN